MSYKTDIGLKVPNPVDLICLDCQINPADVEYSIIKSDYHCLMLTCRLLLHMVKECIASPSIEDSKTFHIVVSKKFFYTYKLQDRLKCLKVQFSGRKLVGWDLYADCLRFTFTFRLSPDWNLIGKSVYLCGSDFLLSNTSIDAVDWNISYEDKYAKLEVIPKRIKLFPINLDCIGVNSDVVDNFRKSTNPYETINLTLHHCPWIYVLPNFTKARVISVSKMLPASCPFDTYKDLRRHWKNMYSYHLPKSEEEMLFYEVIFPRHPNNHFTYPEICIFLQPPEELPHNSIYDITWKFTEDLSEKVFDSICEMKVKLFPLVNSKTPEMIQEEIMMKYNINSDVSDVQAKYKGGEIFLKSQKTIFPNDLLTSQWDNNDNDREGDDQKIDNIEDICCYYDIPSMNSSESDNSELRAEKNETYKFFSMLEKKLMGKSTKPKKSQSRKPEKHKPVIKGVENVCIDLSDFNIENICGADKTIKMVQQQKIQEVKNPSFQSAKVLEWINAQPAVSSTFKITENNNLNPTSCKIEEIPADNPVARKKENHNYRLSSLIDMDSQDSIISNEKVSEDENDEVQKSQNCEASFDEFASSILSDFTPYVSLKKKNNDRKNEDDLKTRNFSSYVLSNVTPNKMLKQDNADLKSSRSVEKFELLKTDNQSFKKAKNTLQCPTKLKYSNNDNESDIFSNFSFPSPAPRISKESQLKEKSDNSSEE